MWLSKKEVFVGTDMSELYKIKAKLDQGGIRYKQKVVANDGAESSFFTAMFKMERRSRGSYGQNPDYMKTYYLYVSSKDYEEALYLMNKD